MTALDPLVCSSLVYGKRVNSDRLNDSIQNQNQRIIRIISLILSGVRSPE